MRVSPATQGRNGHEKKGLAHKFDDPLRLFEIRSTREGVLVLGGVASHAHEPGWGAEEVAIGSDQGKERAKGAADRCTWNFACLSDF